MAQYLGRLQGQRGPATRLGTKSSGLKTIAASWSGAVEVELMHREGVDMFRVALIPWHGAGVNRELATGRCDGKGLAATSPYLNRPCRELSEVLAAKGLNETPAVHVVYSGLGSVSTGTLEPADLLETFTRELGRLVALSNRLPEYEPLLTETRAILAAMEGAPDDCGYQGDAQDGPLEDVINALGEFAPPYAYFGPYCGDGADFGFWPDWEAIEEAEHDGTLAKIADPSNLDDITRGQLDALYVNDHGNATLYQREPSGRWRVVWEVV